jgi:hypothetical protein
MTAFEEAKADLSIFQATKVVAAWPARNRTNWVDPLLSVQ